MRLNAVEMVEAAGFKAISAVDADEAIQILESRNDIRAETTRVHMSKLTEAEIAEYIATGEPMDKAGAYAIQGIASRWIFKIEGDYGNVMGLPIALVFRMLHEAAALPG